MEVWNAKKQILRTNYTRQLFHGFPEKVNTSFLSECDVVFINIGQWPASWIPREGPWPPRRYRRELLEYLRAHQKASQIESMMFVSSLPFGFGDKLLLGQDFRHNLLLEDYNRAAMDVCAHLKIKFLNAWDIVEPLQDLAYDFSHQSTGSVGHALANFLIQQLI